MTFVVIVFAALGLVAIGSGVAVAVGSNLVHCALWLVVTLGALAALYLLLVAEFVAWVQLLVYVGAVIVLLLFALMLTRAPIGDVPGLDGSRWLAASTACATAVVLVTVFGLGFGGARLRIRGGDVGDARALGARLFDAWALPFEVLSVLLLAALVGAIVLSRHHPAQEGRR